MEEMDEHVNHTDAHEAKRSTFPGFTWPIAGRRETAQSVIILAPSAVGGRPFSTYRPDWVRIFSDREASDPKALVEAGVEAVTRDMYVVAVVPWPIAESLMDK